LSKKTQTFTRARLTAGPAGRLTLDPADQEAGAVVVHHHRRAQGKGKGIRTGDVEKLPARLLVGKVARVEQRGVVPAAREPELVLALETEAQARAVESGPWSRFYETVSAEIYK
jgi:hypothetical protein